MPRRKLWLSKKDVAAKKWFSQKFAEALQAWEEVIRRGSETGIGAAEQYELDRLFARMMMIYDITGDRTQRKMFRLIQLNVYDAQGVHHDGDASLAGADEVRAEWADWNTHWGA
jgi:hypothetical protein